MMATDQKEELAEHYDDIIAARMMTRYDAFMTHMKIKRQALLAEKNTISYQILSFIFGDHGTEKKIAAIEKLINAPKHTRYKNPVELADHLDDVLKNPSLVGKRFSFSGVSNTEATIKRLKQQQHDPIKHIPKQASMMLCYSALIHVLNTKKKDLIAEKETLSYKILSFIFGDLGTDNKIAAINKIVEAQKPANFKHDNELAKHFHDTLENPAIVGRRFSFFGESDTAMKINLLKQKQRDNTKLDLRYYRKE